MNFTITISDESTVQALAALQRRLANPAPVLRDVGRDIVQRAKSRFGNSTGPDGQRWRPKRVADGRPTLVGETGSLARQIVWSMAGNTLVVKATVPYAAIHQFGGTIQRAPASMPVRHRTNAKGELLRTKGFNGKGLIFAKAQHKRALTRYFEVQAYSIQMPARPFLPVQSGGALYPAERALIAQQLQEWFEGP